MSRITSSYTPDLKHDNASSGSLNESATMPFSCKAFLIMYVMSGSSSTIMSGLPDCIINTSDKQSNYKCHSLKKSMWKIPKACSWQSIGLKDHLEAYARIIIIVQNISATASFLPIKLIIY